MIVVVNVESHGLFEADLRSGTAQIGAVAPWFDVPNAYRRYRIRAHRWKTPEYFPDCPPELFPASAGLGALPGFGVKQSKATGPLSAGVYALSRL